MLKKLVDSFGFSVHLLGSQRKKEISDVVDGIKERYDIPPASEEKLEKVALNYGIQIFRSDLAVFGPINLNNPECKQIVLPRYYCVSNMAHELGHLVLNTAIEPEADYFMEEITGRSTVRENYGALLPIYRYFKEVRSHTQINPYHLADEVALLKQQGAEARIIDVLMNDIKKHNARYES